MDNPIVRGFSPRTTDKVERLLNLLEEMGEHPLLRGRLALHGGTALNLFSLDVPRLSVDIDVSYVGAIAREGMLAERPLIERGVEEVAKAQGYSVSGGEGGHAGRTFVLGYRSQWGPDHVKVDCIYLNRSPILPLELKASAVRPDLGVLMFADSEIFAGKVKAFFDRVKVRDLYDVCNLEKTLSSMDDATEAMTHALVMFYASLSAGFPHGFEGRTQRFVGMEADIAEQLYPMLRDRDERPSLEALIETADAFIANRVLPRTEREQEYLERFAAGDYEPSLLFNDQTMVDAALANPQALWKLRNLRLM